MLWSVIAVATGVFWLATWRPIPILGRRGRVDVPEERSSHTVPTTRGCGLGILIGASAGLMMAAPTELPLPSSALLFECALVASVGYADDRLGGLSAGVRLLVQMIAVFVVAIYLGGISRVPIQGLESLSFGGRRHRFGRPLDAAVTNFLLSGSGFGRRGSSARHVLPLASTMGGLVRGSGWPRSSEGNSWSSCQDE